MPDRQIVILPTGKMYSVEIMNGEMADISIQIDTQKDRVKIAKSLLYENNTILTNLQSQLLIMYIQQTGTFPGGDPRGDPRDPRHPRGEDD